MKHLKEFATMADYENYIYSSDLVLPNVSKVGLNIVKYIGKKGLSISVGDIAYWDGSKVKTIAKDDYNTSLGTAIGVVVIPNNFLPDGKARIVAVNQYNTYKCWEESGNYVDTSLPNFQSVPITDNLGSSTNGSNGCGYMPSDYFVDNYNYNYHVCVTDPSAVYYFGDNDSYTPSPYKQTERGLILNTDYISSNISNNAFADFDGKGNTDVLVALGSDYAAACHARNFTDGVSNLEYYLPSMGELGVMMARIEIISSSIRSIGGCDIPTDDYMWSSSEFDYSTTWYLTPYNGCVSVIDKDLDCYVRSFAMLD